jgi:hypothetical protein
VAGGVAGLARRMFTPKPATVRSAVARNARNNAKDSRRREKERLWRAIFGRRKTAKEIKRLKKLYKKRSWWERRAWIRIPVYTVARLWDVLAGVTLFGTAAVVTGSVMWMRSASKVGGVVRSMNRESFAFLALPFEGLGPEIRKLLDLLRTFFRRLFGRDSGHIEAATTSTTPEVIRTSPTSPEGAIDMSHDALAGITTNLQPLIEAVREAGSLGEGERPHALTVMRWHRDAAELIEALAELFGRDAGIAAETLPVSGNAHDITMALAASTRSHAEEFREGADAWAVANGTRADRLLDENQTGEEAWDVSTAPNQ